MTQMILMAAATIGSRPTSEADVSEDEQVVHREDRFQAEYSSVEVVRLVQEALDERPALNHGWLETRLYEWLYDALAKYMNKADVVYMLSSLRAEFLNGFTHTTVENLHKVCSRCRMCEIKEHKVKAPLWNLSTPDLMIVVENPSVVSRYGKYLATALKKSGFTSDRIMLTYLTRCEMHSDEIDNQHIANCVPYLFSEMNAVNPKMIMPMGATAWGSVSGDVVNKISSVEGEIRFIGLFPYMPTKAIGYYDHQATKSEKNQSKLDEILKSAYSFLYSSIKEETVTPVMLMTEENKELLAAGEEI